ncbi:hypothetical protein FGG08_007162 [Glutinoglossum americanum]|uniref:T6SS Phospholipase effector Tle1-like catalytic domain-containing protein n=1 Tax=Glutinoglossum americanum TaxID=1670608 RepID=A0A9P8HWW0_9PEZI|nr:hypothetical protein FGG08_007162 [Glutinoglossum americanum]
MPHSRKKRLIVCCDGTWMNSDRGIDPDTGGPQAPSNVTRLVRSLKSEALENPGDPNSNYITQLKYYQAGVGTGIGLWDRFVGGGTGLGLSEHIREAYAFIANNYRESSDPSGADEIFLFGFSRGAFTARSIAGFIGYFGLLTSKGMDYFYEIFKDYENANVPNWVSPYPNKPFPNKPKFSDPGWKKQYQDRLVMDGLTRLNVGIKVVGVWDTVGSLGIPTVSWIDKLPWPFPSNKELLFFDTQLDNENIEYAFQALALDEMRWSFPPSVWELPPGVHSNIGGGLADQQLADITLAWMMSQVGDMLDFDGDYVRRQWDKTRIQEINPREWSFGKVHHMAYKGAGNIDTTHNSAAYAIAGDHSVRTPGQYRKIPPPVAPNASTEPLQDTGECIHASVRIRLGLGGPGINDDNDGLITDLRRGIGLGPKKGYRAEALEAADGRHAWKCVSGSGDNPNSMATRRQIYWEAVPTGLRLPKGFKRVLPEDELGKWEIELLKRWPNLWRGFWEVSPKL